MANRLRLSSEEKEIILNLVRDRMLEVEDEGTHYFADFYNSLKVLENKLNLNLHGGKLYGESDEN